MMHAQCLACICSIMQMPECMTYMQDKNEQKTVSAMTILAFGVDGEFYTLERISELDNRSL